MTSTPEAPADPERSRQSAVLYAMAVLLFLPTYLDDSYYWVVMLSFICAIICLVLAARKQPSDRFVTVMTWLSVLAIPFWLVIGAEFWRLIEIDPVETSLGVLVGILSVALVYGLPYLTYRTLAFLFRGPTNLGWRACPVVLFHSVTLLQLFATLERLE